MTLSGYGTNVAYHSDKFQDMMSTISTQVIVPAIQALQDNISPCCEKIQSVWVGLASDAFVKKITKG